MINLLQFSNQAVLVVATLLVVFWIWMFINMMRSKIPNTQKGIWIILFVVFSALTPLVWFFVREKRCKKRGKR